MLTLTRCPFCFSDHVAQLELPDDFPMPSSSFWLCAECHRRGIVSDA
jgi:hypothetical protein